MYQRQMQVCFSLPQWGEISARNAENPTNCNDQLLRVWGAVPRPISKTGKRIDSVAPEGCERPFASQRCCGASLMIRTVGMSNHRNVKRPTKSIRACKRTHNIEASSECSSRTSQRRTKQVLERERWLVSCPISGDQAFSSISDHP